MMETEVQREIDSTVKKLLQALDTSRNLYKLLEVHEKGYISLLTWWQISTEADAMRAFSTARVRQVLRQELNLELTGKGDSSGHERWGRDGRYVRPALRGKDIPFAYVFTLGQQLETKGFIERRAFINLLK
jgi:hypothetical protein